ncbi:hypothetical protein RJ640_024306 [Escallonia rubra]|uniref:Reverse transcriptase Ty1/copia-type domain-containing protein n=1 Tax=Escallonia rubra TaxID=112253 RepID=A0AA88RMA4_9ASTE|nr:hypothetical protein RJ640_024306 [Escallonia rubra]
MVTLKYSGSNGVREHILRMNDMASQLKGLDMKISEDDILLASSDMHMLHETKNFMSKNFDMKDLGEASYVICIEIHRDRSREILGSSQRAYIDKVMKRFNMHNCAPTIGPILKGDKFSLLQCSRNQLEQDEMERIPYASAVGSLMYAQVCTRLDIAYVVGMLGRYQINPGMGHWKAVKKVMRYLQGTKDFMLTYRKSDNFEFFCKSPRVASNDLNRRSYVSNRLSSLSSGPRESVSSTDDFEDLGIVE